MVVFIDYTLAPAQALSHEITVTPLSFAVYPVPRPIAEVLHPLYKVDH